MSDNFLDFALLVTTGILNQIALNAKIRLILYWTIVNTNYEWIENNKGLLSVYSTDLHGPLYINIKVTNLGC